MGLQTILPSDPPRMPAEKNNKGKVDSTISMSSTFNPPALRTHVVSVLSLSSVELGSIHPRLLLFTPLLAKLSMKINIYEPMSLCWTTLLQIFQPGSTCDLQSALFGVQPRIIRCLSVKYAHKLPFSSIELWC